MEWTWKGTFRLWKKINSYPYGINGGYYPLQVRILLNTGHLGFSDMPLYFYFNVFFVKIASLITSIDTDNLIINTSKIIDSISLPLLVIPLYLIDKNIFENTLSKYFILFLGWFCNTFFFTPNPYIRSSEKCFCYPLIVILHLSLVLFL